MKGIKGMWVLVSIIILLGMAGYIFKVAKHYPSKINLYANPDFFAVTFSTKFAEELGLNWQESYQAVINDLGARYIRIPIYWDEIELTEDNFDFSKYDYIFEQGQRLGVKFVAVIGQRQPRWPECHVPNWVEEYNREDALLHMLETVIKRYRSYPSIEYWQVENEPLLNSFGECPVGDADLLQKEIDLVRDLDRREIILTASGELSSWKHEAAMSDVFGTTMYRVVHNPWLGYVRYFWPTSYYKNKLKKQGLEPKQALIMELQAEPWSPAGNVKTMSQKKVDKSMSLEQMEANLQYGLNAGFRRAYLWGVEWWYWKSLEGDDSYWQTAKKVFR